MKAVNHIPKFVQILVILFTKPYFTLNTTPIHFCNPNLDSVDNAIKDLFASQINDTEIGDIHPYCKRRPSSGEIAKNVPERVKIVRDESNWVVSFTFKSYPEVFPESNDQGKTQSKNWILYFLTWRPFNCDNCRISLFLSSNSTTYPGAYNITYGFLRTLFPSFIDYTRPATIAREDKSEYAWIEGNLSDPEGSQPISNIYMDDSFFGGLEQYFLVGIGPKTNSSTSSKASSNTTSQSKTGTSSTPKPNITATTPKAGPLRAKRSQASILKQSINQNENPSLRSNVPRTSPRISRHLHHETRSSRRFHSLSRSSDHHSLPILPATTRNLPLNSQSNHHKSKRLLALTPMENDETQSIQSPFHVVSSSDLAFLDIAGTADPVQNPSITYSFCYSADNEKFRPSSLCYPYISSSGSKCICWETTDWKTIFMITSFLLLAMAPLCFALYRQFNPKQVNTIERLGQPESPQLCVHTVKIFLRCGYLDGNHLPGQLDLEFKRANGTTMFELRITRDVKWSIVNLMSNDSTDLVIIYKSPVVVERARYVEVIYRKESPVTLIYLYGVGIETTGFRQAYPYCHYLQHDRNVRLSDSQDWNRALGRINMTTSLPITLQHVRSINWLERCIIGLFIFQMIAERMVMQLESYDNGWIAGLAEGLSTSLSVYAWLITIYVIFYKRHNSDRYNMIPISANYQLFALIGVLLLVIIFFETLSSISMVSRSIWRGKKFNHQIAEKYTQINRENDINWIKSVSLAFLVFQVMALLLEHILFKINRPTKAGPSAFDLGYDANVLDMG